MPSVRIVKHLSVCGLNGIRTGETSELITGDVEFDEQEKRASTVRRDEYWFPSGLSLLRENWRTMQSLAAIQSEHHLVREVCQDLECSAAGLVVPFVSES